VGISLFVFEPINKDAAFSGFTEASDHTQKSGFPGAVLATQDVESPGVKLERKLTDRCRAAINLGNVFNLDGRSSGVQRGTSITLGRRLSSRAILLRSILGGAFGLKLSGVEDAIFAEVANGQRL
jgi:hypothetical protein